MATNLTWATDDKNQDLPIVSRTTLVNLPMTYRLADESPINVEKISREDTPDIFSLNEKETDIVLAKTLLLADGIFDGIDYFHKKFSQIDPQVFLLPAETVRKWFYTSCSTYKKISIEKYENCDKNLLEPAIFSRYFNFPTDPKDRPAYYRSNSMGFLNQKMIEDILQVAKRILNITVENDRIVIFGNTPYFVGRAIQFLINQSDSPIHPTIINFPFSGAPNTITSRNACHYEDDLVTPKRLVHFQKRLNSLGLMSNNADLLKGTTYIVDVIGSASGPAFMMETILRDFSKNKPGEIPNFQIISLNEFDNDLERSARIVSHFAKDGEKLELSFPSKEKTHFKIPAQVIYLPGHGDLDFGPDRNPSTRIFPKYNPIFWTDAYDDLLTKAPSGMAQILLDYFDENLKALTETKE